MNYERVHSLLSKASEAIVTADGKIKKRLNTYETVVKQGDNEPFFVPEGAVNDNYGNLNYLTDQIRSRAINSRISNLRYVMYGAFAVILIVFSWSVYSFLLPSLSSDGKRQMNASPDDELAAQIHETQLEKVANLIIMDDDWSNARISVFMKHWIPSSDESREKYKATAWFQQFAFRLENKFNRAIYTGELFTESSNNKRSPLYTLALSVGVADPKVNYAKKAEENSIYSRLESEVTSELAEMEKSRIKNDGQDNSVVADEAALAKLLKDTDGKPLIVTDPKTQNSTTSKATQKVQQAEVTVASAAPPSISEADVSRVLKKYSAAYANGNIDELSTLFGVSDPSQGRRILEQLKSNYENVFTNSQKRSVNFKGLNWRMHGNKATVDSDYSAQIELKNNKGIQTITANAKMDLVKQRGDLKIANFELLNRSVNVTTPELKIASTKNRTTKTLPKGPTAAELQDILIRLKSSYESGDLESFTGLFAANAKTNDRQNLDEIKRDYAQLFNDSNDRQIFIQGMQWTYEGNHAKGTGNLEAIVLSDTGSSVYSMGGKIQLVAQRIDGKVKITHMYHIERTK